MIIKRDVIPLSDRAVIFSVEREMTVLFRQMDFDVIAAPGAQHHLFFFGVIFGGENCRLLVWFQHCPFPFTAIALTRAEPVLPHGANINDQLIGWSALLCRETQRLKSSPSKRRPMHWIRLRADKSYMPNGIGAPAHGDAQIFSAARYVKPPL